MDVAVLLVFMVQSQWHLTDVRNFTYESHQCIPVCSKVYLMCVIIDYYSMHQLHLWINIILVFILGFLCGLFQARILC